MADSIRSRRAIPDPHPVPGILLGPYPQREGDHGHWPRWRCLLPGTGRLHDFPGRIIACRRRMAEWRALDDAAFADHTIALRGHLAAAGLTRSAITQGLACAAVACERTLGKTAFDTQLYAALALLDGCLAEMATGEGKTLAIALAAGVAGMAGVPVHVLTANDYLVARDAEQMAPLFRRLGLTTGAVLTPMSAAERAPAWAADITYATARELVFDYLRDGLRRGSSSGPLAERARALAGRAPVPLLRGLCLALIDEADSILIDEARTPLILSRPGDAAAQRALLWQSAMLAGRLDAQHYQLDPDTMSARLSDAGHARLAELRAPLAGVWKNSRHATEMIELALAARHLFQRDKHYLVRDEAIFIIDAVTGRVAEGRQWSRGLHGLIALKENCPVQVEPETLARITYQRFFRRYLRLGGISGTLVEARGEMAHVYGLPVLRTPLRLPSRRQVLASRCYADPAHRKSAVVARLLELRRAGRAVLLGADSVAASEEFSAALSAAGIAHVVLNARNEAEEAAIVATAGQPGRITVATRMAGRGTDIVPDPALVAAGGLHVLNCQRNDSTRLDRQLAGRTARQGDPGSVEHWLALDPDLPMDRLWASIFRHRCRQTNEEAWLPIPGTLIAILERWRQTRRQRQQARDRARLLRHDQNIGRDLAFAGPME